MIDEIRFREIYRDTFSVLSASNDVLDKVRHRVGSYSQSTSSQTSRKNCRVLRPVVVLTAVMLLIGSVSALAMSGNSAGWVKYSFFADVKEIGFDYPEQLGDYSAKNAKRIYVAPEEYQDYKAFTSSLYTWMTIDYQKDDHHGLSLSFGRMDDPMWAYCFHYDEEGNWQSDTYNYADAAGSANVENLSTVEYRGCTIYLYDSVHLDYSADSPIARYQDAGASWMDKEIGICFSISCNGTLWETGSDGYTYIRDEVGVTQTEILEYVKTIIDHNRVDNK